MKFSKQKIFTILFLIFLGISNTQKVFADDEGHLVESSVVDWVRHHSAVDLEQQINARISEHEEFRNRVIEWRTDELTDYRNRLISARSERLVRWDSRSPEQIFREGFTPRNVDPDDESAVDLASYVLNNTPSIFVGTARYYSATNSQPTRWVPRNRGVYTYEYEIFAPGGIDVNLSLGQSNPYWNQREIAFPGGINPMYIRSAREYNSDGRLVQVWNNGGFNPYPIPDGPTPRIYLDMPPLSCQISTPMRYWSQNATDREAFNNNQRVELPNHYDGEPLRDSFADERYDPVSSSHSIVENPHNENELYVFSHDMLEKVNRKNGETLMYPTPVKQFGAFKKVGWDHVDGIINDPNKNILGTFYAFKGDKYIQGNWNGNLEHGERDISIFNNAFSQTKFQSLSDIIVGPEKTSFAAFGKLKTPLPNQFGDYGIRGNRSELLTPAKPLSSFWKTLERSGYNTIDALYTEKPDSRDPYYMFSSSTFVKAHPDGTIDQQPQIVSHKQWPQLIRHGFTNKIDAVYQSHVNANEYYMLCGEEYIKVTIDNTGFKKYEGPYRLSQTSDLGSKISLVSPPTIAFQPVSSAPLDTGFAFIGSKIYSIYSSGKGDPDSIKLSKNPVNVSTWPVLQDAGFDHIDALITNPEDNRTFFAFSDNSVVEGFWKDKTTVSSEDARRLSDIAMFKNIKFDQVDAVVPASVGKEKGMYIFDNTSFIRADYKNDAWDLKSAPQALISWFPNSLDFW